MTEQQPRWSSLPSGSLFPIEPADKEMLKVEMQTKYRVVEVSTSKFAIQWYEPSGEQGILTPIPFRYQELICRFIYRGRLYAHLLAVVNEDPCWPEIQQSIENNLIHFYAVLSFCRPAFREAAEKDPTANIRFFDIYMIEDCFVGRHEPAAIIKWQESHPQQNLRTIDPFQLCE